MPSGCFNNICLDTNMDTDISIPWTIMHNTIFTRPQSNYGGCFTSSKPRRIFPRRHHGLHHRRTKRGRPQEEATHRLRNLHLLRPLRPPLPPLPITPLLEQRHSFYPQLPNHRTTRQHPTDPKRHPQRLAQDRPHPPPGQEPGG